MMISARPGIKKGALLHPFEGARKIPSDALIRSRGIQSSPGFPRFQRLPNPNTLPPCELTTNAFTCFGGFSPSSELPAVGHSPLSSPKLKPPRATGFSPATPLPRFCLPTSPPSPSRRFHDEPSRLAHLSGSTLRPPLSPRPTPNSRSSPPTVYIPRPFTHTPPQCCSTKWSPAGVRSWWR